MTTQTLVSDQTEQEELQRFLTWFTSQEEIPEMDRYIFLDYVIKSGGMDERAIAFVDETMEALVAFREGRLEYLEGRAKTLQGCLAGEKISGISGKEALVNNAKKLMDDIVENMKKEKFQQDVNQNKLEESIDDETSQTMVTDLKENL